VQSADSLCSRGHPQSEAGCSAFRCYVDCSSVCLGDFGTDIEAQAETFAAPTNLAAEKRLKETFEGRRLNVVSGVGNAKLKMAAFGSSTHPNRHCRCSVDERVGKQVREELSNALAIAFDRLLQVDIDRDIALGVHTPELLDDLQKNRFKRLLIIGRGDKPAAQATAREIEYVLDQLGHPRDAPLYLLGDLGRSFGAAYQEPCSRCDRCQRVPQVVTKNRDELLSQFSILLLTG